MLFCRYLGWFFSQRISEGINCSEAWQRGLYCQVSGIWDEPNPHLWYLPWLWVRACQPHQDQHTRNSTRLWQHCPCAEHKYNGNSASHFQHPSTELSLGLNSVFTWPHMPQQIETPARWSFCHLLPVHRKRVSVSDGHLEDSGLWTLPFPWPDAWRIEKRVRRVYMLNLDTLAWSVCSEMQQVYYFTAEDSGNKSNNWTYRNTYNLHLCSSVCTSLLIHPFFPPLIHLLFKLAPAWWWAGPSWQ